MVKNFSPYKIVKEAISGLKPNEYKVIASRFGIDTAHKTLSSIGRELGLSRERIRQIEKDGLKKLAKKIVDTNNTFVDEIIVSFEKQGGITSHERIAEKFLDEIFQKDANEFNSLHLIFILMPQIIKIDKTQELEAGWMLASVSKSDIISIINDWVGHLKKTKEPESVDVLIQAHPTHAKYKVTFLSDLPEVSKRLVKTESGLIGLSTWPEVNPKNVRDKIYYILKKYGKPLHFNEIAGRIKEQSFDRIDIVRATVHNELIADSRFVLVGRGIYALSEWGYKEGTVAEIISAILKNHSDGMAADEIVKEVSKQRIVKKNTILINLQTKPLFKKVGKSKFALK